MTRAAEQLRLGQPVMSASLARLNSSLADPVLVRRRRGPRRSAYAESIRELLSELVKKVDHLTMPGGWKFHTGSVRQIVSIAASDYRGRTPAPADRALQ